MNIDKKKRKTEGRRQKEKGRREKAEGRGEKAEGRRKKGDAAAQFLNSHWKHVNVRQWQVSHSNDWRV